VLALVKEELLHAVNNHKKEEELDRTNSERTKTVKGCDGGEGGG